MLRKAVSELGLRVTTQAAGRSLLYQVGIGDKFRLRPDICVYDGKELKIIIDTKWKKLDQSKPHNKVSQSDMYQMYAYGKEFQCPKTILLYPRFGDLPEHLSSYKHHGFKGLEEKMIEIHTVVVSK